MVGAGYLSAFLIASVLTSCLAAGYVATASVLERIVKSEYTSSKRFLISFPELLSVLITISSSKVNVNVSICSRTFSPRIIR